MTGSWNCVVVASRQWIQGRDYPRKTTNLIHHDDGRLSFEGTGQSPSTITFHFPRPRNHPNAQPSTDGFYFDHYSFAHARLSFDLGKPANIKRFNKINYHQISHIPDWFIDRIFNARKMRVDIITNHGEDFGGMEFDITYLRSHIGQLWTDTRERLQAAKVAGGCRDADADSLQCVMTTATVDMLGRPDDGFELTAMRRLRAHFGHQTDVLADYVTTSRALLARPRTVGFRLALLAFYATTILPTTALVRIGALGAARATYLTGFAALKTVLRHRGNRHDHGTAARRVPTAPV